MSSSAHGGRDAREAAPAGEPPRPTDDLATLLSGVAQSLQQEEDLQDTLQGIVDAAVDVVPGARHVSISSVGPGRKVRTLAATDDLPKAVDHAQYETGEGPCLDTLFEQRTARIPEMTLEQRWPDFAARAVGLGIASMLAVQLFVEAEDLGALNIFSEEAGAFDDESEHVALLFAAHAAIAMADAQEKEHLRQAMEFRDLIGQAKGILMERFTLTGEQAFTVLSRVSQNSNRRLRDIALELVEQGTLPRLPRNTRPNRLL